MSRPRHSASRRYADQPARSARPVVAAVAACLAASGGVFAGATVSGFSGGGGQSDAELTGLAAAAGSEAASNESVLSTGPLALTGPQPLAGSSLSGALASAAAVASATGAPAAHPGSIPRQAAIRQVTDLTAATSTGPISLPIATLIAQELTRLVTTASAPVPTPSATVATQAGARAVAALAPAAVVSSFKVAAPAGDPFEGAHFFVDALDSAAQAVQTALGGDPDNLSALRKVAGSPTATWFGGGSTTATIQASVAARTATVRAAGDLPVYVVYNIPKRDCGGYSSGGASSPDDYRAWIRQFAAGLGDGRSAIILEPDALAGLDCLSAADQQTRLGLLRDAVNVLSGAGASVYLDAGNSHWKSAATMAARLKAAGVAQARGFSLNVANFNTTTDETAYGDAVVAALGLPAHFIVDTSRNGAGPTVDGQWCNPSGRALGTPATTVTGDPNADALYWIKTPGVSDGTCNGGPAAGTWWNDYAVGLAERAAF